MEVSVVDALIEDGLHRVVLFTKSRRLPIELVFDLPYSETVTKEKADAFLSKKGSDRLYVTGGKGKGNTTTVVKIVSGSLKSPEPRERYHYSITHSDATSEIYLDLTEQSCEKILKVLSEICS